MEQTSEDPKDRKKAADYAANLRVLANTVRLRILFLLMGHEVLTVNDITAALNEDLIPDVNTDALSTDADLSVKETVDAESEKITVSGVNHHIRILVENGFVERSRKDGVRLKAGAFATFADLSWDFD